MKRNLLILFITLATGIFVGWLAFHPSNAGKDQNDHSSEAEKNEVWTCSMHPHIRMDKPGKCPICGMDLIPLAQSAYVSIDPEVIHLSEEAAKLADVATTVVTKHKPIKEIRLYGKVQPDERLFQSQVAHVSGRIESLSVNFTGETVNKGKILAKIYSPELINAQQELIEASKTKDSQPDIYDAARKKLLQWKLTDSQISSIESAGVIQSTIDVVSNTNGIVIARRVKAGDYVDRGSALFDIADLSKVWIQFDAYESDLMFLRKGERVFFTIQALPGHDYSGEIVFVDPVIDPVTRVAKVRAEVDNMEGVLKPDMFASGIVSSNLNEEATQIVIPKSSVLWTGKRSIVYVKQPGSDESIFKLREIELGPILGDSYVVADGLAEGEEIVTSGTFSVDAAAQLEGKPSMMSSSTGNKNVSAKLPVKNHLEVFNVSGNCEMCKDRIEKAAMKVDGVYSADWSIENKKINVEFDPVKTDIRIIQKAIADSGHDTELFKADDFTYSSLPECCLYRK